MKTAWIGLSHLGMVSGLGWASTGREAIGIDPDETRVAQLTRREAPIHEPGLAELLASTTMTFTTDMTAVAACDLVVISRDVPTDGADASDLAVVSTLLDAVIPHLAAGSTLVVMSQIPPGFMRALRARVRPEVHVVYWVETLIFGRALERFLSPERIILGCAEPGEALPRALADGLAGFGCPLFPMRYESAELTKTAINLYLCAAVTYANTLSDLCETVGANWSEMVPALREDARIGKSAYIKPGLGIAGGNLERDMVTLQALGQRGHADVAFIDTLLSYNARRHRWAVDKLEALVLSRTDRPRIAVWGLAYKKNTDSTKNSMSLAVCDAIRSRVDLVAYDPVVRVAGITSAATKEAVLAGADALLVMTDWDEFASASAASFTTMKRPLVIDGVGITDRAEWPGVEHVVMGRCAK